MHALKKILVRARLEQRKKLIRSPIRQSLRLRCTLEQPPAPKVLKESCIPSGIMGQATCHTHPHLIEAEHLTCGIRQAEYEHRRETLVRKLIGELDSNIHKTHIIIIPAAAKQYMSDKIPYVFRQSSDFFYLTGCLEPSAILVLIKPAQVDQYKSVLFVHERDSHAELWEGPRTGCANALRLFAVDEARPIDNFSNYLKKLTAQSNPAVLWRYNDPTPNPEVHEIIRETLANNIHVRPGDPQTALHEMRLIKSPAEIQLMKDVCHIGSQTINTAMACTKPGMTEHQITSILEYCGRQAGAEHAAFPPVVAGGARATHIHYVANNQVLFANDMLLIDSGCQRWLYNSDISRTYPISGKFSKYHLIMYEIVLSVQKRILELLNEHRPPLDHLFDAMCRLLGSHLQHEHILPQDLSSHELISRAYRLCPHHISHYLGLDVHDAPRVPRNIPVRSGMLVTIEPGIYVSPHDASVAPEFRGIGIRIEDDVLITDDAPQILTSACVKEVRDIEQLVGTSDI